jgi:hypothetical protein
MPGIYVVFLNFRIQKLKIQLVFTLLISRVTIAVHSLAEFDGEGVFVSVQESGNPAF